MVCNLLSPFLPLSDKPQTVDSWAAAPTSGKTRPSNVCESSLFCFDTLTPESVKLATTQLCQIYVPAHLHLLTT
jgi:hypothetical protein